MSAPPIMDTKAVPAASVVTSAGTPPTSQEPAGAGIGQSSTTVVPGATSPAPTVVVKQPEPVRPYTGTTSYKAYKEYFERICVCNDWKTPTKCARPLLVAMDGAASEAVRGLKAEQDSDLATIWEALARVSASWTSPNVQCVALTCESSWRARPSLFSNRVCGCSIVKHGRRRISSRLKLIRCCVQVRGWNPRHLTPEASTCPCRQGRLRYDSVQGKTVPRRQRVDPDGEEACDPYRIAQCQLPVHR